MLINIYTQYNIKMPTTNSDNDNLHNRRCVSKYTGSVTDQRKKLETKEDYLAVLKNNKSCIDISIQTAATKNPRNIVKPPVMMDSSSYIEQLKLKHIKCDDDYKKSK